MANDMSIATAVFPNLASVYSITGVNTIDETRRLRLNMLLTQHGSIAKLNEAMGMARTDATLSQIKNMSPHSRTGTPRTMGDDLARRIEQTLGLERGWMDTPPTYAEIHGEDDPRAKVMALMEALPQEEWATAVRLVGALAQPKEARNGTTG